MEENDSLKCARVLASARGVGAFTGIIAYLGPKKDILFAYKH